MILIVDFGSQTAHLIGRRLRQIGVQTEYAAPEEALEQAKKLRPNGIIFSGGPSSVYDADAPTITKDIFSLSIPILGICYGWQLMAHLLGATIKNTAKEYGPEKLSIQKPLGVLKDLPTKEFSVIVSHGDTVTSLP
ncbi:MAG TPA: GMP synthase (glutamine-hydrolyzing), partial [Bacteroidia bacterium]|nr:GMP synthase (glutamine-hydrolyzing) [Bacteroidia bacterium]